ncbi:WYL domain-containing protein [Nonomuraea diastatica]|uniref:WYL domain-containing protein n=1 Tax=Nonomuraea diastatica TaxID=1848329 RepID=A0A4R4WZQ3_9ACTN|nr:WYL domain-containing protein [Nonomuraea diastatica]TDD23383.1 WYL domain-containing protein [Nonomuraea diastatica]
MGFDYLGRSRDGGTRRVEPHHLVTLQGRWYLVAYDPGRAGWRTFRVDRLEHPVPAHGRFTPRELPAPDPVAYLTRSFADATYPYTARLTVELSADAVRSRLFVHVPGDIEARGPDACAVRVSAESAELATQYVVAIAGLGAGFTLVEASEEIIARLRNLRGRLPE